MSKSNELFAGFPAGRLSYTPLPSVFFSHLLPQIDDLAELKVTLHLFWLLHRKKGEARYIRREELADDRTLLCGLAADTAAAREALGQALERAVARGTVLHVALASPAGTEHLYFLNTEEGRRAIERLHRGTLPLAAPARPTGPTRLVCSRPPLFALFEQRIGLLTRDIAEELAEAERAYGAGAVAEAIAEAVGHDARHWAYVKRVLETRYHRQGGDAEDGQAN